MKKPSVLRITSLLLSVTFLFVIFGGSAAYGADSVDIGGRPANPRDDNPRSESIFVYELEPGEEVEDAVKVVNNADKQKTLLVYATDSRVASDGAFACAQKADASVSVGTWIDLAKEKVTLAAGTSEDVPFTLRVPETASAGEQNGCIVIQDNEKSPQGDGIVLSFRSAIRVAVTVPGEITKELDFSGPVVVKPEGEQIKLTVGLKNNGNVSLDTDVRARLNNIFGGVASSSGGTFPILANSEAVFNFEAEKPFWGGWYAVDATATYGSDVDQSVGETGEEKTIASPKSYVFVAPEPLALAVELAVLALIGLAVFRLIHHRKMRAGAATYTVKSGESLHAIAKKKGVSWRHIARINKLKAPYHIEPGQELKVPASNTGSKHDKKKSK